jgi:hypothetical protein
MDVDPQFMAFLQSEEARSYDSVLLSAVETAINSYNGAEYGDEEDGRSQVVARDVAETTDYMLTSLLDAFVSSGRIVEFEPTDESEEDQCDDATEAMHYVYRKKSGYRLIHDWAKAGLLEKIGIVKCCVERRKKRVERTIPAIMLPGETEEELREGGIVAAEEAGEHPEFGPMVNIASIEEMAAEFPDYFVPIEEFGFSPEARDFDSAVYLRHKTRKTVSELVEMGFDPDILATVEAESDPLYNTIPLARDDGRTVIENANRQGALRQVWLNEEYVLYDLNGDGIAERLCVHRVGNTILVRDGQLAIDEVDYQPFEWWCPFPMQGRIVGQSLADKVDDIQRVNTVLERNMLDSLYSQVAPGTYIHEDSIGDHTIDDLLTVRPNRLVRFKGANPPIPEKKNDTSALAMQAIEFKIRQRESRTGITRLNKGVDEDTLNDTASGQKMLMARGQQMERYVIRNFAEGVARLFQKKRRLMSRYAEPFTIKVDGKYRRVDPSQWQDDMDVNVKVGLGSGSKDERIGYRNLIAQAHMQLKMSGSPLVTDENIYNNLTGGCKDMGLPPNDLFTHPDDAPPQQPPPDPAMVKVQAELQMKQQQLEQARQEGEAKIQLLAAKSQNDAEVAQARAELEAHLAVRQQNIDTWLQSHQMMMDAAKHQQSMDHADEQHQAKIKTLRSGGNLAK